MTETICALAQTGLPRTMDWQTYKSLPEFLTGREIRVRVEQPDSAAGLSLWSPRCWTPKPIQRQIWRNCIAVAGTMSSISAR